MAADLDAERSSRGARGPLHGSPVLLKDNYETYDMPTTGASLALRGAVPATTRFRLANCAPPAPSCSAKSTCTSSPSG